MNSRNSKRGSVLIVALVFAAAIALTLASYLRLSVAAPRLADRSFYSNAAQNLADTGLEQTLWSLNNSDWTTDGGFTLRSGYTDQYQGTFPSSSTYYTLSRGVKGQVKVWADLSTAATPHVVAKAIVTLGDGTTVIKYAEAYMSQRSYGLQPMVSRTTLSFNGNVSLDSWDSHSDTSTTSDDVRYSTSVRNTEAGIATTSVVPDSASLQNADIYGRAAIGTSDSSGISVGAGGRLAGSFSAGTGIDFSRVTYDFTTSFPDISAPGSGSAMGAITTSTTFNPGVSTTVTYSIPSISLTGNKTIEIGPSTVDASHPAADVVLIVSGTIDIGGTSQLVINPGSKLKIYVEGNVDIAGTGVLNGTTTVPNNPINFQLFGTRTADTAATASGMQQINIKGTSHLTAVINAPNGDVFINGTADTFGSVLGNSVRLVGSGNFHADESLSRMMTSGIWGMTKWRELSTTSERAAYAANLTF